ALGLFAQRLTTQHFFEVGSSLAALGAVRFVDDDGTASRRQRASAVGAALLGHLEELARHERELLQRSDDYWYGVLERFSQLPRALVDLLHHTALVLELVD